MKITKEQFEHFKWQTMGKGLDCDTDDVEEALRKLGIEVEPPKPPELLPGVSKGVFYVAEGPPSSEGKWSEILCVGDKEMVASRIYSNANARLLSKSKDMAEWMAKMLVELRKTVFSESFPKLRREGKAILGDAGANMEALK